MNSMNIRRFHAPTAREALALARATFGDDTLILSNRQLDDGVEVVAAAESELSSLESAPPVVAPSKVPAPAARTLIRPDASTQEIVKADTEKLSMSTLSFQDYVRERMLRRQHDANTAPAADPAPEAPAVREQAAAPRAQAAIVSTEAVTLPAPATPQQLLANAAQARAEAHAIVARESASVPMPVPAPMPTPAPAAPDLSKSLMAELGAMKLLMEDRFNTLAWLGQAKQDPIHSNLMLKLVRAGYSPALARSVLEKIDIGTDASAAVRGVMTRLSDMLGVDAALPSMAQEGGVFALIGATGVGKTTTAAKLAAECARLHGAASVGLVTLDTHRAGAHEQLRAYGRSLGVVAHLAHDRAALQELLTLLSGKKMVLIDTAGVAPRDPRRRDLLDLLDMPAVKRVLVLNAGAHGDTLDEMATSFKIGGTRQAILSKTDEAAKIGPALDTVMRHEFQLRGIANGQRIPQDWKAANADELVRESMRAAQRSPFDPRSADVDFFFSPAACAL